MYRPYNQQRLGLSVTPLDASRSHIADDNQRNTDRIQKSSNYVQKCSSYILHESHQIGDVDQFRMFDFDPVQVKRSMELEELPEAVNTEILKNSREIVFREGGKISGRNAMRLHRGRGNIPKNREIIFKGEEDEEVSIRRTLARNLIDEEKNEILKSSQEIVFGAEEEEFLKRYLLEKNAVRSNEERDDIIKSSQEIAFEKENGDFLERNPNTGKNEILKGNQEVVFEKEGNFLTQRALGRSPINVKLKNTPEICESEELSFVKVEENRKDVRNALQESGKEYESRSKEIARRDCEMRLEKRLGVQNRRCQILPINRDLRNLKREFFANKEQISTNELSRSLSDDYFIVNGRRSFRKSGRNATSRVIVPSNQGREGRRKRDQRDVKRNIFVNQELSPREHSKSLSNDSFTVDDRKSFRRPEENVIHRKNCEMCLEEGLGSHYLSPNTERKSLEEFDVSSIDNVFTVNETRSFGRSGRNAIDNMRNVKMPERSGDCSKGSRKYILVPFNHSDGSPIFCQRSNYDFPGNLREERYDNVRIERERTPKRLSSDRLAKIAVQHRLRPNDFGSSVSSVFNQSPESGFCEGNLFKSSTEYGPECDPESSSECGEESHLIPRNEIEDIDRMKEDGGLSESGVTRKDTIGGSEECAKVAGVEIFRHARNDIQDVDDSVTSLESSSSGKRFLDDDNNPTKYAKLPNIRAGNNTRDVDENRSSSDGNLPYRYFVDRDNKSEEHTEILDNCTRNDRENVDENRVSSRSNLSYEHSAVDDPVNCSDAPIVRDVWISEYRS